MAIRVHILAKELGVTSKAILDKSRAEGLDVKNHMSVLSAGLEATIREWFSEGAHETTEETAERVNLEKIQKRRRRKVEVEAEPVEEAVGEEETAEPTETGESTQEVRPEAEPVIQDQPAPQEEVPSKPDEASILIPAARVDLPDKQPTEAEREPEAETPEMAEPAQSPVEPEPSEKAPTKAIGPMNVPTPAVVRGPRVVRVEKPEVMHRHPPQRRPIQRAPSEPDQVLPPDAVRPAKKAKGIVPTDKEEEIAKQKKVKSRVNPRRGKVVETIEQLKEWRDRDLLERSQRLAQASDHPTAVRRAEPKKQQRASAPAARQGKVQVCEPIILKDFCSAIGVPFSRLFPKLMEHGIPATINQSISADQAELLAMELGLEIEVIRQKSRYEHLVEQFSKREHETMKRRSPVVTFLGHVDHGKTSLLDHIRKTRVAAGEAGGITQHIGAYRVPIDDRFVVFLDTPGHEAFTALRARGAHMTDIVVLVVAGNDGVMPQTVEAISHAKAANVPIVVAMNKIDLPNVDQNKIMGQLAEHQLIPAEWGGEVDVIRTSAITGEGMDELVEHLNTLADLLDLKADPTGPATGLVIESRQDASKGAVADLLVQEGTLSVSDIVLVGGATGRVRAMLDDTGKPVQKAGPATPVEILGLDGVAEAGDRFFVLTDLSLAQEIADEKRQEDRSAYLKARTRVTLENIFEQVEAGQVHHLNLIIKADTQGSMDVLRSKLTEMGTNEVKVRILHSAVGGITEGDVLLAEASSAIILGFGVVADDIARNKAQTLDVEIRTYTVIYHLLEDITSAMEGMLTPTFEQKVIGRATVREVFKVTRVGTVAGCMVSDGVVERSAKVRIIRQNVIIRENATLESLKRFKDDAREVRQGFECGIKIANFDDIKEGDIIEAYQQVEVARKLQPAGSAG